MANDSNKGPDGGTEGSWSPRRRGASSTRTARGQGGAPDPDQLAQDIERTREDLAETLDAIADKVSPKRVVDRKKTQAKADAQQAVETVKEATSHAAEVVKEKVGAAGATAKVKAAGAADSVKAGVAQAKERVSGDDDAAAPVTTAGALADAAVVRTDPAGADAPGWTPYPVPEAGSKAPLLAGAGAAVLVLVLVLRRRRRR